MAEADGWKPIENQRHALMGNEEKVLSLRNVNLKTEINIKNIRQSRKATEQIPIEPR